MADAQLVPADLKGYSAPLEAAKILCSEQGDMTMIYKTMKHGINILVAISSTESRVLTPQKTSILESQSEPLSCYKIQDHGLATTQEPPILVNFGLYLGRSLIL